MKWIKRIFILLLLGTLGAAAVYYTEGNDIEAPVYKTDTITRGNIRTVVSATGILNPAQIATVGSQVSGKVKLHVKANEMVKSGQLLAEIDPALILAQLKQDEVNLETARSNFEQAQRDLERTRMLVSKDYVAKVDLERSQQLYLSSKNNYESIKTVVERDKLNLDYAKITSPIDGTIIALLVTEGQTLQASFQTPDLFRIVGDLTQMKIDVNFGEADINKIKPGNSAVFTVNAFPNQEFGGVVQTVNLNPQTSGQNVSYSVTIDVKNDDYKLLPGMNANVSIVLSERNDILKVPATALRFNPPQKLARGLHKLLQNVVNPPPVPTPMPSNQNSKYIYILHNDVIAPVLVQTGVTDELYVEVSGESIKEGDIVVVGLKKSQRQ